MLTLTKKNFINLIQIYVPLEEHGSISSGYCPFCFDNEETFLVYPDEQKWHCFGCEQTGNIYQFIERAENLSVQEAVDYIACFINDSLDKEDRYNKTKKSSEEKADISDGDTTLTNLTFSKQETTTSETEAAISEVEMAVSKPEIMASKPETIISEADNINDVKKLLDSFDNCKGCQGIAIIHYSDNKLIGSSIDDFDNKDIQILNSFVKLTLKLTTDILGEFDKESSKLIFRMNITMKSIQKKLVWVPMLSKEKHKYNFLMLLDSNINERMLLIKLKNHPKQIGIPDHTQLSAMIQELGV